MRFSILFFLTLVLSLSAGAQLKCDAAFAEVSLLLLAPNRSAFAAKSVENFFNHQTRQLYYRIDEPAKFSGTTFLIHGLGDHSGRLNKLTDALLQKGQRVIRVDLHGHGRTLKRNLELGHTIDEAVPFESQVEDVTALIRELGLDSFTLVGHSYGGGVAPAVASRLSPRSAKTSPVNRMVLLAPLVMDLRKYYTSGLLAVDATRDLQISQLKNAPMTQLLLKTRNDFTDRYFYGEIAKWLSIYQRFGNLTLPEPLRLGDQIEKATERLMQKLYRPYFEQLAKEEGLTDRPDIELTLDNEVTAAIRVTQGIGDYSLFDRSYTYWSPAIKTAVVAGSSDGLVPIDLLRKTALHLKNLDVPVDLVEVNSGHLMPQTITEELIPLILGRDHE